MSKPFAVSLPLVLCLAHGLTLSPLAGTWSDNFSGTAVGQEWRGDTDYFSILDGALMGFSVSPLAPVPLHLLEVGTGWSNCVVQCRINVVVPNLAVCTKGALILRHEGKEGYLFALHVATRTVEVYRLSDHEMLLTKEQPLELKQWYTVRADLQGETMTFFVEDQLIGMVTDARCPSGAVGLAVQDTAQTLFDDFSVTGPAIFSNGLEAVLSSEKITLTWPVALSHLVLKTTTELTPSSAWETVTNTPIAKGDYVGINLNVSPGIRFFKLLPR